MYGKWHTRPAICTTQSLYSHLYNSDLLRNLLCSLPISVQKLHPQWQRETLLNVGGKSCLHDKYLSIPWVKCTSIMRSCDEAKSCSQLWSLSRDSMHHVVRYRVISPQCKNHTSTQENNIENILKSVISVKSSTKMKSLIHYNQTLTAKTLLCGNSLVSVVGINHTFSRKQLALSLSVTQTHKHSSSLIIWRTIDRKERGQILLQPHHYCHKELT